MRALEPLFAPRRLAILGASRNPAKLGHALLRNILEGGFPGEVLVVNPGGEPILGRPTVPDVTALPGGIDLALVSLPPRAVLAAVSGLADRGTRTAVILTSGFGEVGAAGQQEQSALLAAARTGGMRLVGPNCIGVYSRPAQLNGTYFWDLPRLPGGVGVVSQSGAYGGLILRHLGSLGLGVSRFLSIGNQVDVEVGEAIEYLAEDPETRLIACFIESVPDGRGFVEAATRATARKPTVVLKAGHTEAGRRAAGSHTGSLAGAAAVYQAAFRRAGIVACAETEEFFDAIHALASPTPRPERPTLAILTVSGGPSVVAADAAESLGLDVPRLPATAQGELRRLLPSFAAVGNPVDMTPQVEPAQIPRAAERVLGEPSVAGALAVNVGHDTAEFADGLIAAARGAAKPLVACAVDVPDVIARLRDAGVPVYPTPERAVRAYRALWLAGQGLRPAAGPLRSSTERARPPLPAELAGSLSTVEGPLRYEHARALLSAYGIRFCRGRVVGSVAGVLRAAEAIGYPVVVKSARPDLLHKTDAGAVVMGVEGPEPLRAACRAILERVGETAFLVQEQVAAGTELLVGGRRDETFGPVVVVGSGGVLAELLGDISLDLAPVGLQEATRLVALGPRARLAEGYRGRPGWRPQAVAAAVVAVGTILLQHPRVLELDVNPVIVRGEEAVAVDALVILAGDGRR